MLAVENLSKRFGTQVLFQNAAFSLGTQERIGVVGPNGAGKSTFFKILTSSEDVDDGRIHIPNNYRILLMEQEWSPIGDDSVVLSALKVFEPWFACKQKLDALSIKLENSPDLLGEYQDVENEFLSLGGYQVEFEVKEILGGLGFKQEQLDRPAKSLSGGWRMRCYLAGLLVQKADLLLLDEPTNHLDMSSVVWFENFLQNYPNSLMMISHDRRLVENIAKKILEFSPPKLTLWSGGLKKFESSKEIRMEQLEKEITHKTREVEKLKNFARRFGAKASKARQGQSKLRSAEVFEEEVAKLKESMPIESVRASKFSLVLNKRQPKVCIQIEDAKFGYNKNANLFTLDKGIIESGKKIGILGDNGVGKTTFLRTIAGEIDLLEGKLEVHSSCKVSLFSQHRMEELPLNMKAIDYLIGESKSESISQIRGIAASLGLGQVDMDKNLSVMSGGEKARVSLARILLQKPDILLLDEPTNHLDLEACDALVAGLVSYTGTVIAVSHNRDFLDGLVKQIYYLKDGRAETYLGSYAEFAAAKNPGILEEPQAQVEKVSSVRKTKEQKRQEAMARQEKSDKQKDSKQELQKLEMDMKDWAREIKEIDVFLTDPTKVGSKLFAEKLKLRGRLEDKIALGEENWLKLQEKIETC